MVLLFGRTGTVIFAPCFTHLFTVNVNLPELCSAHHTLRTGGIVQFVLANGRIHCWYSRASHCHANLYTCMRFVNPCSLGWFQIRKKKRKTCFPEMWAWLNNFFPLHLLDQIENLVFNNRISHTAWFKCHLHQSRRNQFWKWNKKKSNWPNKLATHCWH